MGESRQRSQAGKAEKAPKPRQPEIPPMKQESVPVVNVEVKVHHQKQEEQADVKMQDQASP